jgi:non-ribosomal peptide synthetase component F
VARQAGVTFFTALLTAFQVALFRWKGADDVVLGTPHANRTTAQVRGTMGYFAGVVPLRVRLDPGQPYAATLAANQAEVVEDFAHAMPFAELAACLGEPSGLHRHPVFDVRFALQNHPVPDIELPGISTRLRTCSTGTSRFDIACELTEDGQSLEVVWLYRPSLVNDEEIGDLDRLLLAVLEDADRTPGFHPGEKRPH